MARIYKRDGLTHNNVNAGISAAGSPKKKDEKARKRNIIMNFRVTAEEKAGIDERIRLSGLKKSEYFISSCMDNQINVFGNVKTFDAIRETVRDIDEKLEVLMETGEIDAKILEQLRMVAEILDGVYRRGED